MSIVCDSCRGPLLGRSDSGEWMSLRTTSGGRSAEAQHFDLCGACARRFWLNFPKMVEPGGPADTEARPPRDAEELRDVRDAVQRMLDEKRGTARSVAKAFLENVAAGGTYYAAELDALAYFALLSDRRASLALAVLDGGPHAADRAIELALLLYQPPPPARRRSA